ncbi:MAG: hypothetical protein A4E35_00782 [Methanoregula sp. PtaU1.Bin051]|nr:MAG: hypothetical protein A4E35_00782 [Methanoregula sp. PtaU1.Bin051]
MIAGAIPGIFGTCSVIPLYYRRVSFVKVKKIGGESMDNIWKDNKVSLKKRDDTPPQLHGLTGRRVV